MKDDGVDKGLLNRTIVNKNRKKNLAALKKVRTFAAETSKIC